VSNRNTGFPGGNKLKGKDSNLGVDVQFEIGVRGRVDAPESRVDSYVVEPQTGNSVHNLMRGRDEIFRHDERKTLAERGPAVVAPRRRFNTPFAATRHELTSPGVTQQKHVG